MTKRARISLNRSILGELPQYVRHFVIFFTCYLPGFYRDTPYITLYNPGSSAASMATRLPIARPFPGALLF